MGGTRPPAGLGYLAEVLEETEVEYRVFDMCLGYGEESLKATIADFRPDLVGLSIFSLGYRHTYELARHIRGFAPGFKLLVGGPHVSTLREAVLAEVKEIDYGIVMEGEETLGELCSGEVLIDMIKGLIHRKGGKVMVNPDREFISDLDRIPFPRYAKFELDRYVPEKFIITSRGCPYQCIYCAAKPSVGSKIRLRSAENVLSEMLYWYERGYRQFNFVDDNFTISPERVYALCGLIEGAGLKDLFLLCTNGIRADRADRPLLARMKEVGFQCIYFGVEAGNDKVLKALKKGSEIATMKRAVGAACELGYDVGLFFLVGSPSETEADIADSVAFARSYPIVKVNFYNIIPYPRTELYRWIEENGYFLKRPEEYLNDLTGYGLEPAFETPELSRAKRIKILEELRKVEKEITRKALKRKMDNLWFLGGLIAFFFTSDFVQALFFKNNRFRAIVEKLRYLHIKRIRKRET